MTHEELRQKLGDHDYSVLVSNLGIYNINTALRNMAGTNPRLAAMDKMLKIFAEVGVKAATTLQPDGQLHPYLRGCLEHLAEKHDPTDETLLECVTQLCRNAAAEAATPGRLDELERVSKATLDADRDVWSTTDDGQIISLTERIKQLMA